MADPAPPTSESTGAARGSAAPAGRSSKPGGTAARGTRRRPATAERREEILRAAAHTFGAKGYKTGSLADVAEQVGMTHAGVLHHFGSKEQLLIEVLEYRDKEDVRDLEGQKIPSGLELFVHLLRTVRANEQRRGVVQGYTVLTGESVTEGHPAAAWAGNRFSSLRGEIVDALRELAGPDVPEPTLSQAASAIIAVMDGLQVQWLLDPDAVHLAESTTFAIEAIVAAAVAGAAAPLPVPPPAVSGQGR